MASGILCERKNSHASIFLDYLYLLDFASTALPVHSLIEARRLEVTSIRAFNQCDCGSSLRGQAKRRGQANAKPRSPRRRILGGCRLQQARMNGLR